MGLKVCQLCAVDFTLKHFLLPLVDAIRAEGWEVVAICSGGETIHDLRKQGYQIITTNIARNLNVVSHLVSAWQLYRIFQRERFDVLHVHTPIAAFIGRVAGRLAGIPLIVYTAHGFYFHDEMPAWKRHAFVWLEKFAGLFTDLLFTQSQEDSEEAIAVQIAHTDNVIAIGNGVDASRFTPLSASKRLAVRQSLGIPADARVVGIVGRLVREKGYPEFLQAAAVLAGQYKDAYFMLIGSRLKSDHNDSIDNDLITARDVLGERLVTTGFRNDTPDLIGVMDIFCLPSHREGMPRTIIEAMMMGKPVVATDIRGSREEVIDGETGLLVPTRSSIRLAEAIGELLRNPSMAEKMGEKGRERALEHYVETRSLMLQISCIRQYACKKGLLVNSAS